MAFRGTTIWKTSASHVWVQCYEEWAATDGVFAPSGQPLWVNLDHVRAIASQAPGVSRLYVNLSDRVAHVYVGNDPPAVLEFIRDSMRDELMRQQTRRQP